MPDAHKLHTESVFSYHNRQRLTLFFNLDYEGAQEDDKEEEEESEDDEESLSDDNLKSPSGLLAVPKVQRIGIDGSATSILSKGWDNPKSPDLPALPSVNFPPSAFAFAIPARADKAKVGGP